MTPTVLIVDDDTGFARAAGKLAADEGCGVQLAGSLAEARAFVRDHATDLILLDLTLPDGNGMELLDGLDLARHGRIVVATGRPSVDTAVRAIASPVVEYLVKPFRPEQLQAVLRRIGRRSWPGLGEAAGADELAGASPAMRRLSDLAMRMAACDMPVLLAGERGSGRAAVARAIHAASGRKGPFVLLDCDVLVPERMEEALFGTANDPGASAFARADGGTLLVNGIERLPHHVQARLLAIVEGRGRADGGKGGGPRLLFCTAGDPARNAAEGLVREDFHYGISALTLRVPSLRERGEDVVTLAELFVQQLNERHGQDKRLAPCADRVLLRHPWPGNVRELRAAVQSAYLLQRSPLLHVEPMGGAGQPAHGDSARISFPVGTTLAEMEQRAVDATLAHFGNDKAAAARALGISVRTIYNHLARREGDRAGCRAGTG
ncbi:two component, sigma54 specific, transcriptional regulator, Fis family [Pseudoxanthomonas suwonensis 11-1]|uniref:Two component, sigma54 specific, transcriptional regulator, Fis family n=1 Tax=Pseudoxanthomonas suwonensis (strain 11-1) TaxID=743721 RepID=E6WWZ9_PSEUU|nr:sigma 54-interacting transcriptional regulator [Pseudoxanthomonas suwonensis]ADV28698.1 two component, sigma54 specific, transcriptional regulator, Fis family [Pseudoxanthomonas suwonensis 11-1]